MSTALRIAHGAFGRVTLLDLDRSLVRHAHPHCHVMIKVEGADAQLVVGRDLVRLGDDQAVLVNAWESHAYVHLKDSPRTVILALYIEPDWLRTFRPNWIAGSGAGFFERPAGDLGGGLGPRIRRLGLDLAALMMAEPDSQATQERLVGELMIAVTERFTPWRELSPLPGGAAGGLSGGATGGSFGGGPGRLDWRIQRMVRLIRLDPRIAGDVNALAKESGLSRAHFYRLFERSARMTPHVYVNLLRTELAVSSVVATGDSLSAVGGRLGFSAPSHFTRFFRDHTGVTPSEFRQVAKMGVVRMGLRTRQNETNW
jgi:AraC family transcriptional regulator